MRSSYSPEDVVLLLKDITGQVEPQSTEEREKLIQAGKHYCEMLPIEYKPSEKYMQIYNELVKVFAEKNANAIGVLADQIMKAKGNNVVLVSLARAGIPIGILLKHYISFKYNVDVSHYSISIIRGRGIDKNAMKFLLDNYKAEDLLFVDGWTGKGAINHQLEEALVDYPKVSKDLAVVADPAGVAKYYGTREDLLIPSCCLNSTVSGLISRTFLRDDIIGADDFHGAVYYEELKDNDLSYAFINAIEEHFKKDTVFTGVDFEDTGLDEAKRIAKEYNIHDINLVKPSIGEATRVLLRRVPWKVLISDKCKDDIDVAHIIRLAEEKNVLVEYTKLNHYKAVGLIKEMADA